MNLIINKSDYENPLKNGKFLNKEVPNFKTFEKNYHIHFLRYLYYICVMCAEGDYPENITLDEIKKGFASKKGKCKPKINKILIGEAPPDNHANYFYNTQIPWVNGNPKGIQFCWTKAIKDALFPNTTFITKIDFLVACAKKEFILIDLFPYPISGKVNGRSSSYKKSIIIAIKKILNYFDKISCLQSEIAIAFGLKRYGEIILDDTATVITIKNWLHRNHKTLTPPTVIEESRLCCCPLLHSKYLRVCGARGYYHPLSCLLIQAGIR